MFLIVSSVPGDARMSRIQSANASPILTSNILLSSHGGGTKPISELEYYRIQVPLSNFEKALSHSRESGEVFWAQSIVFDLGHIFQ